MTVKKALDIATWAHEGQIDKSGNPYIEHPKAVADMVEGDAAKMVALLHDVIEDTCWSMTDLRKAGFCNRVLDAVDAITKRDDETHDAYLGRVKTNELALVVKLADIAHNESRIDSIPYPATKDRLRNKYEDARKILC